MVDQLGQTGLVIGISPRLSESTLSLDDLAHDDGVAEFSEAGGGHETDPAGSDDSDGGLISHGGQGSRGMFRLCQRRIGMRSGGRAGAYLRLRSDAAIPSICFSESLRVSVFCT